MATQIKIKTEWVDLLPQDLPMVEELKQVIKNYDSDSGIVIILDGNSRAELIEACENLAVKLKDSGLIRQLDYRIPIEYLNRNALLLLPNSHLERILRNYPGLGFRNLITAVNVELEESYIDPVGSKLQRHRAEASHFLEILKKFIDTAYSQLQQSNLTPSEIKASIDKQLSPLPYILSADQKSLMMVAYPKSRQNDDAPTIRKIVSDSIKDKQVISSLTGAYILSYDEIQTIKKDTVLSTLIATVMLLVLFMVTFKIVLMPLYAMIPVQMALVWTLAFINFQIGHLNLITSLFGVILLGLGIDQAMHMISHFTEERVRGKTVEESIRHTFVTTAPAILTGSVTTSIAFFSLMIANFKGISELGLSTGVGMIFALIAVTFILPSLLVLHGQKIDKHKKLTPHRPVFALLAKYEMPFIKKHSEKILITIGAITVFFFIMGTQIKFDRNPLNMMPQYLESVEVLKTMVKRFGISPDTALLIADNIEESQELTLKFSQLNSIALVDSINSYFPAPKVQQKRFEIIQQIREKINNTPYAEVMTPKEIELILNEIKRFEININKIAGLADVQALPNIAKTCRQITKNDRGKSRVDDLIGKMAGNQLSSFNRINFYQSEFEKNTRNYLNQLTSVTPIYYSMVPEIIKKRFIGKDGRFLITLVPNNDVRESPYQEEFIREVQKVHPRVTGTVPLYYQAIKVADDQRKIVAVATFLAILVVLLIDFKNPIRIGLALIPLFVGNIWLLGLMGLFGIKYNVVNMISIPLLIGIGIDYGVHYIHRYVQEGKGSNRTVLESTGRAIFLASLTNICGFASLLIAQHRGLYSFGLVLSVGIFLCFLVTIFMLPAMIEWLEKKGIKI
jgi:predicted RND superfamily exporter protein